MNELNERIVKTALYGQHIILTCKNHPSLKWTTKNILYIGARHIFFAPDLGRNIECNCDIKDLIIAPEQLTLPEIKYNN